MNGYYFTFRPGWINHPHPYRFRHHIHHRDPPTATRYDTNFPTTDRHFFGPFQKIRPLNNLLPTITFIIIFPHTTILFIHHIHHLLLRHAYRPVPPRNHPRRHFLPPVFLNVVNYTFFPCIVALHIHHAYFSFVPDRLNRFSAEPSVF
ncbi:hypothetical protein HanRHA438_Chr01g0028051 [Helianthus annuus]|nr:hypothetical protein HanRHA438_Chr01g0028051 [Helianthus annuus]